MKTLLINTAASEVSVAIVTAQNILAERSWPFAPPLGDKILQAIDEMIEELGIERTQITCVAAHRGPGNYSALRTGVVIATLLAEVWGVPLKDFATKDYRTPGFLSDVDKSEPRLVIKPEYPQNR